MTRASRDEQTREVTITSRSMPIEYFEAGRKLMAERYADQCVREAKIRQEVIRRKWQSLKRCMVLLVILVALIVFARVTRADAVSDLKAFQTAKLPAVAVWSHTGFGPNWHIEQVRAGHHVIPAFQFKDLPEDYPLETRLDRGGVTPENLTFLRESGIPINLRSDNWAKMIAHKNYRVAPSLENLPLSKAVITLRDGIYGDDNLADAFAPPNLWQAMGQHWGKTNFITQMQALAPNPAFLLVSNNNETNKDSPWRYGVAGPINEVGNAAYSWKPNLETLSVRVAEYAKTHAFGEFARDFNPLVDTQYKALLTGLKDSFTAWQDKVVLSDCYGGGFRNTYGLPFYNPDMGHHDGGGGIFYGLYGGQPNVSFQILTSPKLMEVFLGDAASQNAESLNPNAFREVFVSIKEGQIFLGAQAGRHAPITPARWEACAEWLVWTQQGGTRGKLIRPWYDNSTKPESPFIVQDVNKALAIQHGEPELLTATFGDYVAGPIRAVDRICEHPTLRRFYQDGKAVVTSKAHPVNEIVAKPDYSKIVPPLPRVFPDTPRTYPRAGDPDDGFRQLEVDINTPREVRNPNAQFRSGEVPHPGGAWVNGWVKPPWANSAGGYWPGATIKVWAMAIELNGDYLIHMWSPCKLSGTCQITIPNSGTYSVPVPQPNDYRVVHKGSVLTLDEYAAAIAKTPFDIWWEPLEANLTARGVTKEFARMWFELREAAK